MIVGRPFRMSLLVLVLAAPPLLAQGPPPGPGPMPPVRELPPLSGFSVVPFSFGPPGARSMGMGGTFIALADDATAAEANPAGLTKLSRPEVSLHARYDAPEVRIFDLNAVTALDALNRFRTAGPELRPGDRFGNAFAESTRATFAPSGQEISFASYVQPFQRTTWSISYQRAASFEGRNNFRAYDDSLLDLYQTRQELDLSLENLGLSMAFRAGRFLSLGVSLRYSRLTVTALQSSRIDFPADLESDRLSAGASLEELQDLRILDRQIQQEVLDDRVGELTFNAGILINPDGRLSLGLVYKNGGDYEIDGTGASFGCMAPVATGDFQCLPRRQDPLTRRFKVPDFFGVGIAWRATNRLKLAFDANAITYSDLSIAPANDPNAGPGVRPQFEPIDDEVEMHFGAEYIFFLGADQIPLTVRAGAYTDPDHDPFRNIDSDDTLVTFGFGIVLMESFQLDLGAAMGDWSESAILSLVYRF